MAKTPLGLRAPTNLNLTLNTPAGSNRISSNAHVGKYIIGQEYLGAWFKHWRTSPTVQPTVLLWGDSTMVPQTTRLQRLAVAKGFGTLTIVNSAVSGTSTDNWLTNYGPTSLAANDSSIPKLLIMNQAKNDPFYGITEDQTIAKLASTFALIRNRSGWGVDALSLAYVMPNTCSDDGTFVTQGGTNARDERWQERMLPRLMQLAMDYGVCFIDGYSIARDARNNIVSDWLDSSRVHPNNDFYDLIWGTVADALFPSGMVSLYCGPTVVTPAGGFSAPSGIGALETMSTFKVGPQVQAAGYLIGSGSTLTASVGSPLTIATVAFPHRPRMNGGVTALWRTRTVTVYSSGTNFEQLLGQVTTGGAIQLLENSTLASNRVYFDANWPSF